MNFKIKEILQGELHFVDTVPKALLCMLCNNIMVDSTSIPCGCEFCRECLENYFDNQEKECPCKDAIHPSNESKFVFQNDFARSHPTNSKIIRLKLKCKNCEEVKTVEDMSKHIDKCHNGIKCLFSSVGCDQILCLDDLSNHMIKDIRNHNQMLLDMINNLINEQYTIKNTTRKQNEENHQLKDEIRICRAEIDSIKQENGQLKDEMKICRTEIDCIKEKNLRLQCQNEDFESRMSQIEKISVDQQSRIEDTNRDNENTLTNISNIETKLYDFTSELKKDDEDNLIELNWPNPYKWTIEDFDDKRNSKEDLYSDPFYTHRSGYKVRIGFFTNDTTFNNFALVSQIMKGDFDDSLPWPMRKSLIVSVIDQDTGESSDIKFNFGYYAVSYDCRDCFLKPTEQYNESCHRTFTYNKIYKGRYRNIENPLVKNNKLIIKCDIWG